jgi:hypothetical protein
MIVRPLLAALAVMLATAPVVRADALSDVATALPGQIQDVRTIVHGNPDDGQDIYRIIIARDGIEPTARLFVQWLSSADTGAVTIERTVDIKEMLELKRNIGDFVTETDEDGLSIFVELIDPAADGAKESYELFISDDATYRFGPASN